MPEVAKGLIICAINEQLIELSKSSAPVDPVVCSLSTIASIVPDLELHLQPGLMALKPVAEEQRLCLHLEQLGKIMQHMEGSNWRAFYRCVSRLMRLVRGTEAWMRLRSRTKSDRKLPLSVADTSAGWVSTDQKEKETVDVAGSASYAGKRLTTEEIQLLLHIAQQLAGESNVKSILLQFCATQKSQTDEAVVKCHCVIVNAGSDEKSASFASHEIRKVQSVAEAQVAMQQSAVNNLKTGYPLQTVRWDKELRWLNLQKDEMLNRIALLQKSNQENKAGPVEPDQSDQLRQQQIMTLQHDQRREQMYEDVLELSKEDEKVQQRQLLQGEMQVQFLDKCEMIYGLPDVKCKSQIEYHTQMLQPNKVDLQPEIDPKDREMYKQIQMLQQTQIETQLQSQLNRQPFNFHAQKQTQPEITPANKIQLEHIRDLQKQRKEPLVLQTTSNTMQLRSVEQMFRSPEYETINLAEDTDRIRERWAQETSATSPVTVATYLSELDSDQIEMQPSRSLTTKSRTGRCSFVADSDARQSILLTTITTLRRSQRVPVSQPDLASTRTQTTSCESHDNLGEVIENSDSESAVNRQGMQREVERLRSFPKPSQAQLEKPAKNEKRAKSHKRSISTSRRTQKNPPTKGREFDEARNLAKDIRADKASIKKANSSRKSSNGGGALMLETLFVEKPPENHKPLLAHPVESSISKKIQSTCNTMSFSEERVKVRERKSKDERVVAKEHLSHVPPEKISGKQTLTGRARLEEDQKKRRTSSKREKRVVEKPRTEPTEEGFPGEQQATKEASSRRSKSIDAKKGSRKLSKEERRKEVRSKVASVPVNIVGRPLAAADLTEKEAQLEKCRPASKKPVESKANFSSPSNLQATARKQYSSKDGTEKPNERKSERRDKGK